MLTLRQALRLPVFETAKVVAGVGGLDRVIRRAHVVDIPGTDFGDWGEGLLLFTAGYGLKNNPEQQLAFIPAVAQQGLVGMVFSLGWYFDAVPEVMRRAADKHNFTIVTVPYEVSSVTILERLYVDLVNDQFATDKRAEDIHRRLTALVLDGRGLDAVASTLADILERSVLFESSAYEILAHADHGQIDENRRQAIDIGHTPAETVQRMVERGIYHDVQACKKPLRLPTFPELGMTMERVVAPIMVGQEVFGYIWILAGDRPFTRLDELATENTATVVALMQLKDRAVRDARNALRGDFLAELLRSEQITTGLRASTMAERGHALGYRFDVPHQIIYVRNASASTPLAQLTTRVEEWARRLGVWVLVATRDRGVAVVIESQEHATGQALADQLLAALNTPGQPVLIGIGRPFFGDSEARQAYEEARDAAQIGERLSRAPRTVAYWTLGILYWLEHLPEKVILANPYYDVVLTLAQIDAEHNSDLVATLEAYLDYGGAIGQGSAVLGIHRNTLLYRVARIEELLGIDLKGEHLRFNLHAAVKAYLLRGIKRVP